MEVQLHPLMARVMHLLLATKLLEKLLCTGVYDAAGGSVCLAHVRT